MHTEEEEEEEEAEEEEEERETSLITEERYLFENKFIFNK